MGKIDHGSVAIRGVKITRIGKDLPSYWQSVQWIDVDGMILFPGF